MQAHRRTIPRRRRILTKLVHLLYETQYIEEYAICGIVFQILKIQAPSM